MSKSRIRFAPDILRRLGEELNPHPAAGIIELVKNAYDADARNCVVKLTNVDESGGEITIEDDGDGMTEDQIKEGWLVIGHSQKEKRRSTRLGRIPAGSKGLGRLAALRLGQFAKLETRPRTSKEIVLTVSIDWQRFDQAALIDDVELPIRITKRPVGVKHGTVISLGRLTGRVGRVEVKRLARAMLLLADPFGDSDQGFQPNLISTEFTDLQRLVSQRYFSEASFHLVASINPSGKGQATVQDYLGKTLFSAKHADLIDGGDTNSYKCPPLNFDLWVFILNVSSFQNRSVTIREVQEWLGEFGGVHLYHNGLRVAPYGDPGNDWLGMNLSRARSPEERPSTNTSIGRVLIHDQKENLVQKTDRSGFIESEYFDEIRRFAMASLEWMASERMKLAEKRRTKARVEAPHKSAEKKRKLDEAIDTAPANVQEVIRKAAADYDKSREKEAEELRKEIQLYRTLSTVGITAATFAHESQGNPLKAIHASIETIERRGTKELGDRYKETLAKAVERVKEAAASLGVLDAATMNFLDHAKRRAKKVDLHVVITSILDVFGPFFDGRGVKVETDLITASPFLLGSDAAVESIVTNLLNNSLTALESVPGNKRRIRVQTSVNDNMVKLSVLDTGKGIRDIKLSDIWLPGRTTRKNGTGLGLTIVKDTVADLGGAVGVNETSDLGGAEVFVELPIIGV